MYIRHLTPHYGHKIGTVVFCGHGGVRDYLVNRMRVCELVEAPKDDSTPPSQDDGTDSGGDDAEASQESPGPAAGSVPTRRRVRKSRKNRDTAD